MARRPNPTGFVDTDGLTDVLDGYDRCLYYTEHESGEITATSGRYPHWRRFQRDLHGPTINIQGHGYVMTHVHKRKITTGEYDRDENCSGDVWMLEYSNRPEVCIVTLTPITQVIKEGQHGPEVRA